MASFTSVVVCGNLTRDPESRTIASGKTVTNATIAVNKKYGDTEQVAFIDCTIWGKTAEAFSRYHRKGDPVLVGGELKMDQWQDKATGANRSKLFVDVHDFTFVKPYDQVPTAATDADQPGFSMNPQQSGASVGGHDAINHDDIPF